MNFSLPKKIKNLSAVFLAAVVLLLAVILGMGSGKTKAQALLIAANAVETGQGLSYFYSDYSRFPTAVEYQDQNLMLNYFNQFPPRDFASGKCSQSYAYKRISNSSFQLNFCLPQSIDQYKSGWNTINDKSDIIDHN